MLALVFAMAMGCSNTAAVKLAEDSANQVCACKDAKCARDAIQNYEKRFTEDFPKAKGTPGDVEKIQAAGKRINDCWQKLSAQAPE